jgi:probable HAF family extracellular repeat protein
MHLPALRRFSPVHRAFPAFALSWLCACGGDGPSGPPTPAVAKVEVTAPATTVRADQTLQLTATLRDASGQALSQPVTWRSEDSTVVRVDANGVVTGMLVGTADVVATSGGKEGRLRIGVSTRARLVAIGTNEYSLFGRPFLPGYAVGRSAMLRCTVLDSAFASITTAAPRWSTSNPAVAVVADSAGITLLRPLAPGRVTVSTIAEGVRSDLEMIVGKGYTLTIIPGLPGPIRMSNLNEQGHVVGSAGNRAFLWRGAEIIDLGLPGSVAWDVNDAGQVVGEFSTNPSSSSNLLHAFLWQNGQAADLTPGSGEDTHALAINAQGDVAGYAGARSLTSGGPARAVVWRNGQMTDLGALGGYAAYGIDINAQGDLAGFRRPTTSLSQVGFFLRGGQLTDLAVPSSSVQVVAVSDDGTVLGNTSDAAFLWKNGTFTPIPTASGSVLRGSDVNRYGQAVGYATTITDPRAFVWIDGAAVELTGMVTASSQNHTIRRALAINDRGQIVVETQYAGTYFGLLTPVP